MGRDRFAPLHRFLTDDEAFSVGVAFRQAHPQRLRLLSTILGWALGAISAATTPSAAIAHSSRSVIR